MKVYELIQKLLKAPAGANVYIRIGDAMYKSGLGDEVISAMTIKDKDGNIIIVTR
jgi:hypothetical protein